MGAVEDVAQELYALDVGGFTAARTEAAGGLGSADARAVRALRKPTVPAWAVNQLVREAPEQVDALVGLGEELQAAQGTGDGALLRELDRRRRTLVAAAVEATVEVADRRGQALSGAALAGVESTLRAAVLDPGAASLVQQGCLDRALEASGFGSVSSGPAAPWSRSAGTTRTPPRSGPRGRKQARADKADAQSDRGPDPVLVAEAERHLAATRSTLEDARTAADVADAAVEEGRARVKEVQERVAELRSALEQAEGEQGDAERALAGLREDAEAADDEHDAAELAVAAAERDRRSLDA